MDIAFWLADTRRIPADRLHADQWLPRTAWDDVAMWREPVHRGWLCGLLLGLTLAAGCANLQPRIPQRSNPLTANPADPFSPAVPGAAAGTSPLVNASQNTASSTLQNLCNYSQEELRLTPREVIAPVGGQVVLKAEVLDRNGGKGAHRRVEWMLDSTSVGQLLADHSMNYQDLLFGLAGPQEARKFSQGYASSRTLKHCSTITRGTATRVDDVDLVRGDAWIAASSAVEGDSYITAFAPDLHAWDRRQQNTIIHWVDVQWNAPPSSLNAVGQAQPLVVTVARRSDGTPIQGWKVRYEVTGGPAAGFLPDGAAVTEVETDLQGQAVASLTQATGQQGTNEVNIQLIRPASAALGQAKPLTVGGVVVQHTWTSPDLGLIMSGPTQGSLNADLPYRITLTNGGAAATRNVQVSYPLPSGYELVSSLPPAPLTQGRVQFPPLDLQPGQQQTLELVVKATQAGTAQHCAEAISGEGLRANNCITTVVGQADLDVRVELISPVDRPARVGETASFLITLVNRGNAAINNVTITDTPGPGLLHPATTPEMPRVKRSLTGPLMPGGSEQIQIDFTTAQEGRLTHQVEVIGDSAQGSALGVVDVVSAPAGVPAGSLVVEKVGPFLQVGDQYQAATRFQVGDFVLFRLVVENRGQFALENVVVEDRYDTLLKLSSATVIDGDPRYTIDQAINAVVWNFNTLLGGQKKVYEVLVRIDGPGAQLCSVGTVTADRGITASDRLCVSTFNTQPGAPGTPPNASGNIGLPLTLTLVGRPSRGRAGDPIRAGDEVTLALGLKNNSRFSDKNVRLSVAIPAGVEFVNANNPGLGARYDAANGRVLFQPIAELAPGEVLPFTVSLRATTAGRRQISASVQSDSQPTPLAIQETLQVLQ